MKQSRKRLLALVFAVCLALTLTPTVALAALLPFNVDISPPGSGTVSADIDGAPLASFEAEEDETVTLTAMPDSDHRFVEWEDMGGLLDNATAPVTAFTMPGPTVPSAPSFTAVFEPILTHDIIVEDDGFGTGVASVDGVVVTAAEEDETVTLTATPNPGYRFLLWEDLEQMGLVDPTNSVTTFTVPRGARPSGIYLKATFEPAPPPSGGQIETVTIRFDGNGATGGVMPPAETERYVSFTLPTNAFAREGYDFIGWNTRHTGEGTFYPDRHFLSSAEYDMTLYAQWSPVRDEYLLTICYHANGGAGFMPDESAAYGSLHTLSANLFALEGYAFVGWSTQPDGEGFAFADQEEIYMSQQDLDLYAQWAPTSARGQQETPTDSAGRQTGGAGLGSAPAGQAGAGPGSAPAGQADAAPGSAPAGQAGADPDLYGLGDQGIGRGNLPPTGDFDAEAAVDASVWVWVAVFPCLAIIAACAGLVVGLRRGKP